MTRPVLPRRAPFLDNRGLLTRESALYLDGAAGSAEWATIEGKPSTFPPSTHGHAIADVSGLQSALDGKAAVSHTHAISDVIGLAAALARVEFLFTFTGPGAQAFEAPHAMTIDTVEKSTAATATVTVNAGAYTLGAPIAQWDDVEITTDGAATVFLIGARL